MVTTPSNPNTDAKNGRGAKKKIKEEKRVPKVNVGGGNTGTAKTDEFDQ
jgi:hypothetical protein